MTVLPEMEAVNVLLVILEQIVIDVKLVDMVVLVSNVSANMEVFATMVYLEMVPALALLVLQEPFVPIVLLEDGVQAALLVIVLMMEFVMKVHLELVFVHAHLVSMVSHVRNVLLIFFGPKCIPCICENDAFCKGGILGNGYCECKSGFAGKFCNETAFIQPNTIPPGGIAGIVILIVIVIAGIVVAIFVWWKFFRNATFIQEEELNSPKKNSQEFDGDGDEHESSFNEEKDISGSI